MSTCCCANAGDAVSNSVTTKVLTIVMERPLEVYRMRRWRLILHSCDTKVTKDPGDDHLPSLLWGQIDVVDDPDIRPRIVHGTDELTAIGRDGDAADFL